MSRRSVPLNGLRAFEAAARHLSFAKGADELHVTPAAISQQIRSLEEFLGQPLFIRGSRGIELSLAGKACLPHLQSAFDQIDFAVSSACTVGESRPLTIRASPCVATKWLLPRLPEFQAAFPDIEIAVSASSQIQEFRPSEMDMILRVRCGTFNGLTTERVLTESVFPVCSPTLRERIPLDSPADLERHTLLHDDTMAKVETFPDWARWLDFAGVPQLATTRGHRFSLSTLAIDATVGGRGVALGRSALVEPDLDEGRLVRPFDLHYPVTHDYFLIYPKDSPNIEPMMAFRDWVIDNGRMHTLQ